MSRRACLRRPGGGRRRVRSSSHLNVTVFDRLSPDALFLLPELPRTARLVGEAAAWAPQLAKVGVELRPRGEVDLVVASSRQRGPALAQRSPTTLLVGTGLAPSRRTARVLLVPDMTAPTLALKVGSGTASRYAARHWTDAAERLSMFKHRVGAALVGFSLLPPLRPMLGIASAAGTTPAVVATARRAGLAPEGQWFMVVPSGTAPKRGAFFLFGEEAVPELVVKFARLRGYDDKFRREERGLASARAAGRMVSARAPQQRGDIEVAGFRATVHTAARGAPLGSVLRRAGDRSEKLLLLDRIASWLRDVSAATMRPSRSRIPAVFEHGDLADGNIIVSGREFTVIDWELATSEGVPLRDLLYLCLNALPLLDGAVTEEEHVEHLVGLFRGTAPSSGRFFGWLSQAGAAVGLGLDDVPQLVMGGLAHHAALRRRLHSDAGFADEWMVLERLAQRWPETPGLGPSWTAWAR